MRDLSCNKMLLFKIIKLYKHHSCSMETGWKMIQLKWYLSTHQVWRERQSIHSFSIKCSLWLSWVNKSVWVDISFFFYASGHCASYSPVIIQHLFCIWKDLRHTLAHDYCWFLYILYCVTNLLQMKQLYIDIFPT